MRRSCTRQGRVLQRMQCTWRCLPASSSVAVLASICPARGVGVRVSMEVVSQDLRTLGVRPIVKERTKLGERFTGLVR